jgi:hypothetical protein
MLLPNRSSEDFDLAAVLQGVGFAMLFAFLAIFAKFVFPVALLQPAWQLRASEGLRGIASIPLVAVSLLLLAEYVQPDSPILAKRVLWIRRLSVLAALGFFFLVPLQITAGLRQISQATVAEYRELRAVERAATAIQKAATPQEMLSAIKLIPGLPPDVDPQFNLPIPAVRTALLAQIRPQILKLETRIRQVRSQRIQAAITVFAFDALVSVAYGIGFAAIGRTAVERPTLLQQILWAPSSLQGRISFFGEALLSLPSLLPRFRLPCLRLPRFPSSGSPGGAFSLPFLSHHRHPRHPGNGFRVPFFLLPGFRRSSVRNDLIPQEWLDDESEPDDSGPRS